MKIWALIALGLFSIVVIFYSFFSGHGSPSDGFVVETAFAEGICDDEAVLVQGDTTVLENPDGELKAVLPVHSPLYICGENDGYITIVFPKPGAPANCSSSTSETCLWGVVAMPLRTITLG